MRNFVTLIFSHVLITNSALAVSKKFYMDQGDISAPLTCKLFHLNKKYEIVVTIKTIITQIERLARSCFSLEFECKKLGSTNINTPTR